MPPWRLLITSNQNTQCRKKDMTPLWYFFCFSPAENPSSPSASLCNKCDHQKWFNAKAQQNEYYRSICSYILDHVQSSFLQMRSQSLTAAHALSCKKLPVHTTQLSLHVSTRGQQTATTQKMGVLHHLPEVTWVNLATSTTEKTVFFPFVDKKNSTHSLVNPDPDLVKALFLKSVHTFWRWEVWTHKWRVEFSKNMLL